MNAKERFYSGLAKETIGKITSNKDNWTSFLVTMSRNYEFTYPEQVMIYAQRPNATFCKPYDEWNDENYRRYVRRGSTGIALFVTNREKPYLRYVFDVADTGVRRSSPELKPWEVTEENRAYVMDAMERTFGITADGLLEAQLEEIALSLSAEYWDDYKKPILDIVANSFLEEYDELNIEVAFKRAVANSVSYAMYCRLVENPDNYFEHEDFLNVFDFNTRQTVNALGTAVNAISSRMFQEIEKAIGEYEQNRTAERSADYERNDLQTGRGLQNPEYQAGERGSETAGQVWQDEKDVPGAEQSDAPERHDSDGDPVPPPVGDRGNGESQSGTPDEPVPEEQPRTGQRDAADGVGAAHGKPESTGGGSRDDGAYQQLTLNLFLTEEQQIRFIDEAESQKPSAFSFSQEEIDHFLLLGSNTDDARKIVVLDYMKQKPVEEIAQTLKQVYHGGFGLKEDSGNISAWYAGDGIHLAKGSSAIDSPRAQIIPWEDAAKRIGELLDSGRYANLTFEQLVEAMEDIIDDRDTEIISVLDDFKKYCFDEKLIPDGHKWMRAIVAGTTFQDNMDLNLFYDQEARKFSEHGYIGLYKDKSIRAIGRLKKTIIAVEVEGKMTYRAESGEAPTPDEICRINEAIHRAEDYGYNLRTISHRYFMVEKFYPIDFRKSSKNPIQKSKFFNLADMFGYKTMPDTEKIAADLNGRTWEEF